MKTYNLYKVNLDLPMLHLVAGDIICYDAEEQKGIVERTYEILPPVIKYDDTTYFELTEDKWVPTYGEGCKVNISKDSHAIGDGVVICETPYQLDIAVTNGSNISINKQEWKYDPYKYNITKIREYYFISSTGGVHTAKVGKNTHEDDERYGHYNIFKTKKDAEKVRDKLISIMKELNPYNGDFKF
jgi:hypothetical protein